MNKKLLVIGHGRHGKDTVCEILRDHYGYTFESSSQFCSKLFIYFLTSPYVIDLSFCLYFYFSFHFIWFSFGFFTNKNPKVLSL